MLICPAAQAYSVLTHEAIIDSAWDRGIKPLLLKRFPNSTPDDLLNAHAYAYGGCIIQDMGYYPFGSKFFSDLAHYVRSGDFVANLLSESQDLNEFAFALGALAHYVADNEGHPLGVNPSVAIEYPKVARRYGEIVTYEENPKDHLQVEFGFDVLQVASGHYAPKAYHDFIGFQVSKPLLERAFRDTYSLELKDVFTSLDLALGTYRHTVGGLIPEMTKAAWAMDKKELRRAQPGLTRRRFVYNLSRASYRKQWDGHYETPGIGARILSVLIRVLPKIGPFKALGFKPPTPQTATLFENSFNNTMDFYLKALGEDGAGRLRIPNRNLDTGQPPRPAQYHMADGAYSELAVRLGGKDPASVDPKVRQDLLAYFNDLAMPFAVKKDEKQWSKTLGALNKLKTAAEQAGMPTR